MKKHHYFADYTGDGRYVHIGASERPRHESIEYYARDRSIRSIKAIYGEIGTFDRRTLDGIAGFDSEPKNDEIQEAKSPHGSYYVTPSDVWGTQHRAEMHRPPTDYATLIETESWCKVYTTELYLNDVVSILQTCDCRDIETDGCVVRFNISPSYDRKMILDKINKELDTLCSKDGEKQDSLNVEVEPGIYIYNTEPQKPKMIAKAILKDHVTCAEIHTLPHHINKIVDMLTGIHCYDIDTQKNSIGFVPSPLYNRDEIMRYIEMQIKALTS